MGDKLERGNANYVLIRKYEILCGAVSHDFEMKPIVSEDVGDPQDFYQRKQDTKVYCSFKASPNIKLYFTTRY